MADIMPTERYNQKVKYPLTPRVLEDIGIIDGFPPVPTGFAPQGDWSQSYRIWLCHGYYGLLNLEGGYLRIERRSKGGDEFTLSVVQKFVNWEGIVQTITAEISCRNDELSSPSRWEYSSEFRDADDSVMPKLSIRHKGRIEGNTAIFDIRDMRSEKRASQRLTADWCIFDAIQRLQTGTESAVGFDMLELMTVLKTDQTIRSMESRTDRPSFYRGELTRFVQTGRGVLPWEYWLDSNNRLVLATSGDRAYILDNEAEERFGREVAKHREGGYSWKNRL